MSAFTTTWRYLKGVLSGLAVLFGMVGVILLVEIYEGIPDTLSIFVAVIGIMVAGYVMYKASRPKQAQSNDAAQPEVEF